MRRRDYKLRATPVARLLNLQEDIPMCGIAGLIWKGGVTSDIGSEMTQMLQALKHRGPDSTGFALYGKGEEGVHVWRLRSPPNLK